MMMTVTHFIEEVGERAPWNSAGAFHALCPCAALDSVVLF